MFSCSGFGSMIELIQRRSRDNVRWQGIPKDNCVREEAEFEVVIGCAEDLVLKTMTASWMFFFLCSMVFNATFNNISVISWRSVLLVEETEGPGENHRPVSSHWQTLSHNIVHLALIKIRTHNITTNREISFHFYYNKNSTTANSYRELQLKHKRFK